MASAYTMQDGQTARREQLITYYNCGAYESPTWDAIGCRVTDSSIELDWGEDTSQDILGHTHTSVKEPTMTQGMEDFELEEGQPAYKDMWERGVRDHSSAVAHRDLLIVHAYYAPDSADADAFFAERYPDSAVLPTSIGGEGGGGLKMAVSVTFGGARETGTASINNGTVTFTKAA
jgi:hypothetical protein